MGAVSFRTDPQVLSGSKIKAIESDFSDAIAFDDHKIAFAVRHCSGLDVLDLGCVQHDPANRRSRYWVHRALCASAKSVVGLDLSREGVEALAREGFDVVHGDAQSFDLGPRFDAIYAGDLIEHLEDFSGFLESAKRHLRPGGALFISTPNPWYWKNVVHAALRPEVPNNPEHTCWLCPRTLRQLALRHGLALTSIEFGSRYWRDRVMPLPRGLKHTSWHGRLAATG